MFLMRGVALPRQRAAIGTGSKSASGRCFRPAWILTPGDIDGDADAEPVSRRRFSIRFHGIDDDRGETKSHAEPGEPLLEGSG